MMTNTVAPPASEPIIEGARRRVSDATTRTLHWLFSLSFAGAYITADGERLRNIHMMFGYAMIGLLAARLVWGLIGPKRVRLSSLASRIKSIKPWVAQLTAGRSAWQIRWTAPQNATMATLIAFLMVATVPLVLSGYLTNTDVAGDTTEEVHEFFGELYLALVILHIATIGLFSIMRKRNLAMPMLTGYLPEKGPDLAKNNFTWLAVCILAGTIAWCVYYLNL